MCRLRKQGGEVSECEGKDPLKWCRGWEGVGVGVACEYQGYREGEG